MLATDELLHKLEVIMAVSTYYCLETSSVTISLFSFDIITIFQHQFTPDVCSCMYLDLHDYSRSFLGTVCNTLS